MAAGIPLSRAKRCFAVDTNTNTHSDAGADTDADAGLGSDGNADSPFAAAPQSTLVEFFNRDSSSLKEQGGKALIGHFVMTEFRTGLTPACADQCIALLKQ